MLNNNKRVPLYYQVMDALEEDIKKGKYTFSQALPSEHDLCKRYKISRITAIRALKELEKKGRIVRIHGKGSFLSQPPEEDFDRAAEPSERKSIVVILPFSPSMFFSDQFYCKIWDGMEATTGKYGYDLSFFSCNLSEQRGATFPAGIDRDKVAGAVVLLGEENLDILSSLVDWNLPFVVADYYLPFEGATCVVNDNFNGALDAVEYLISLGHTRIAHLTYPIPSVSFSERQNGYQKAMEFAGLKKNIRVFCDEEFTHRLGEKSMFSCGEEMMKKILASDDRPSAIFATNDMLAIGAMKAISEANLKIPEDISVVGFDGIELGCCVQPRLTTVEVFKTRMGKLIIDALIDILKVGNQRNQKIIIPTELVIRESCGAAPKDAAL